MYRIRLAFLIFSPLLAAGCRLSTAYSLRVEEPHKDVLLVEVDLSQPLSPPGYRWVAEKEIGRILAAGRKYDAPVYEVRFEYFAPVGGAAVEERVATYVWRRETVATPAAATLSTASNVAFH